jgi:hypothetical protein
VQASTARRIGATVLVVVGAIGLVVASAGWWLERSFLDTSRFTSTANSLLDRSEIQAELTSVLVRQLSKEAGADLQVAQPFLAAIVQQVVDSGAFRTVFDTALSRAHKVLVDRGTEKIILDLTGAYDQVRAPLQQVAPNLAGQLPSKQQLDVVLLHRSQLTVIWDLIDRFKRMVDVVTIAAVVLVAAGIALAVDRWRALALAGWVVVGGLVVVVLALLVTRIVASARISDGTSSDAVRAAFTVVTRPLVVQSVVLAAIAALVALAARFTAYHGFEAWRGATRRAGARIGAMVPRVEGSVPSGRWHLPPPRSGTRGAHVWRALGLVALGLFAVLEPDTVTDLVAVVVGLALLYLAVLEAVAAAHTPSRADEPRAIANP